MAVNLMAPFFLVARRLPRKAASDPRILWINGGVKQLGVSVNGGTPKTPQNDHF